MRRASTSPHCGHRADAEATSRPVPPRSARPARAHACAHDQRTARFNRQLLRLVLGPDER